MQRLCAGLLLCSALLACDYALADDIKAVFVYTGGKMSPVAQITQDGIANIGPTAGDADEADRWFAPWFAPGSTYHYLGRDANRGTGTATGPEIDGCWSLTAGVKLDTPTAVDGLLTNYELPVSASRAAIRPSPRQLQVMQRVARGVLRRNEVPADVISKMITATNNPRFFAITAHGQTPPRLIASYDWDSVGDAVRANRQPAANAPFAGYSLTLILEADKSHRYRASHALFHHADAESGVSSYGFVTAADLDGDGLDEVILVGGGYEWWWFEVLGKRNTTWKMLASGGGGGC
jgi:hypothetical protein